MVIAASKGFRLRCTFENRYFDCEHLMLRQVARNALADMNRLKHQEQMVHMVIGPLLGDTDNSTKSEALGRYYRDICKVVAPWLIEGSDSWEDLDTADLKAKWEQAFGSLDSPQVQADLAAMRALVKDRETDGGLALFG